MFTKVPWSIIRVPSLPQVALKVLQLVSKDALSLSQLSALIAADQAFASEVLTIVNSPLYTLRAPVTGIMQGIIRLGLNRLKGIAITVGIRGYMGSSLDNPALRPLWRHSLACALLAELYAPEMPMDVGAAYTAGIMHDLGRVVLAAAAPEEYANLLSSVGSQAEALKREKELFGLDHCELGRKLVIDWNLPHVFADVTSRHHTAENGVEDSEALAVVRFACKVADAIGFAAAPSFAVSYQELLDDLPKQRPDLLPTKLEELALWISTKILAIESGQ